MIHLLFSKCVQLLQSVLGKFFNIVQLTVSALKRLCYHVAKVLGPNRLTMVFNQLKDDNTSNGLADQVVQEFKRYQLEKIPTSFIEAKPEVNKRKILLLKYAYSLVDVEIVDTDDNSRFCCLDHYWRSISSICNGKAHYRELCTLVNCILSLSRMN